MDAQVFISHSEEDRAVAENICAHIEAAGIQCWMAPRDIAPGDHYARAIIQAIHQSRVMIFVFSSHSNESPHVLRELECAVSKGICIIPFRIEEVRPSISIQYFISTSHWLDAVPTPSEDHFSLLSDTVGRVIARDARCDPLNPVPREVAEISRSRGGTRTEKLNEYVKGIGFAEDLLSKKQWAACVRECGAVFEKGMRRLLGNLLSALEDRQVRQRILNLQQIIGDGETGLAEFDLARLVRLFREAEVFSELRKHLTSNLHKMCRINWDQAVRWYGASKGTDGGTDLGEHDAMEMLHWAKVFVYDSELDSGSGGVPPLPPKARVLTECSCCNAAVQSKWSFCPECGAALKVTCESCHRVLAPDFKICPYCEARVRSRGFGEKDEARRAQEEYRVLCTGAYLDGVVNFREKKLLDNKRLELGLSMEEAEKIERCCAPENIIEYTRLVEGVLVDGIINESERAFLDRKAQQLNVDPWSAKQIEDLLVAMETGESGGAAAGG